MHGAPESAASERSAGVPGLDQPVVLFDGLCNLCSWSVRFIVRRDSSRVFLFTPLGSEAAREVLARVGYTSPLPDTFVLVEDGAVHLRSTAVLRVVRRLPFPWPLMYAFIVVPRPLRNWAYGIVARNRYKWFGKKDACAVSPEDAAMFQSIRERFLG